MCICALKADVKPILPFSTGGDYRQTRLNSEGVGAEVCSFPTIESLDNLHSVQEKGPHTMIAYTMHLIYTSTIN